MLNFVVLKNLGNSLGTLKEFGSRIPCPDYFQSFFKALFGRFKTDLSGSLHREIGNY